MRLMISAAITARWGHRVDGLIHTHAWKVVATVDGPPDAAKVMPADDLEQVLTRAVTPWTGHYLTDEDVGEWKGYQPLVWDQEATVEEIVRRLWDRISGEVPHLSQLELVESDEFDRCRTVRLSNA